jgi:hypothetical protein
VAADIGPAPDRSAIPLISFATPLWLLGLLLVPVIRWLHRGGPNRREVAVASIVLWRSAAARNLAAGVRRPPDPAWRRRALGAALLCIALAGPQGEERRTRVTLWVDDSLSMLVREAGGTRLQEGLALVRSALAQAPPMEIEVRTLGDPWRDLGALGDGTLASIAGGAGTREPEAPPAPLLNRDSLHWLLTDGAHARVLEWPDARRPDRVFTVGEVTRNVGIERLSVRRSLRDPEKVEVLLKITNGGSSVETRSIAFATDAGEFARSELRLEPGASANVTATMPLPDKVRAALQPTDALVADDEIAADLDRLRRRRVAVDRDCPPALLAAVRAHPALALAPPEARDVDAALTCGASAVYRDVPTIRVHADRVPVAGSGALLWSASVPDGERIDVDPKRLGSAARLEPRPGDAVLLAMGDQPLIVERPGAPRMLDTIVDFAVADRVGRPDVPLLVDFLFGRLFGGRLLDAIVIVDRGPAAAMVVPADRTANASDAEPHSGRRARSWARPFVVSALLVLLWEIVALGRAAVRLRDRKVVVSS